MLKPGSPVPAFTLQSSDGSRISASSLRGRRYVLYFYPKDDTPGCTKEACGFRDNLPAFGRLSVPVFGVSADSDAAHRKFVLKYGLNFPLLADPERTLIEPIGAWVEKSMYGRKYMGIARCTFVIGTDGRVQQVWEKVTPEAHAAQVLEYLAGGPTAGTSAAGNKPATKRAAKKAPATKAAAKKVRARKAAAKKAAVRKVAARKSPTTQPPAKKAAAKKAVGKRKR